MKSNMRLQHEIETILGHGLLTSVFQPIVDLKNGTVTGHEGLIRGPANSSLSAPTALFQAAGEHGLLPALDAACRTTIMRDFSKTGLQSKIFLNTRPDSLTISYPDAGRKQLVMSDVGISLSQIVIEITECEPTNDYGALRDAAAHYREQGLRIAIDDLGEGFSSLRLWSELMPEYVKIDKHFIRGINLDPVKLQFVRSIQHIAAKSGTLVIAEGIETEAELQTVCSLGIPYGQGYFLGRPSPCPTTTLAGNVTSILDACASKELTRASFPARKQTTAASIRLSVPIASAVTTNNDVYDLFLANPKVQSIPVVENGIAVGIINRLKMIDRFARQFQRELLGRKSCSLMMDLDPLTVELGTSLQDLSHLIVESDPHHLWTGFIIADNGRYAGVGTGHDLMRELTQLQIHAARYANPLTQLPGNVPINERLEQLSQQGVPFTVCYCDLDHFKPFNDLYGYRKGDEVIELTADILCAYSDPHIDFVGHIGGDDFIIVFQSADWEYRTKMMLDKFSTDTRILYEAKDWNCGGYMSENRQGAQVFNPLISISFGIVLFDPPHNYTHHQISAAAAEAKAQAKKIPGNSIFIERRK